MTALEQFNTIMESEIIDEPIERLRFFISLALTGQDWLDIEQFIDGVSQQLAEREKQVAKAFEDGRQAEREECAIEAEKQAQDEPYGHAKFRCHNIAEAIRARGEEK